VCVRVCGPGEVQGVWGVERSLKYGGCGMQGLGFRV